MTGLAEHGARLLGGELESKQPLSGGDISDLFEITLTDGRTAIVKSGPAPRTEAEMLAAIHAAGAPAPKVLAVDDTALVLSKISASGGLGPAWSSIGSAVRKLHESHGDDYGWNTDFAFGRVRLVNDRTDEWPHFWAKNRLLVHLPDIPADLGRRVEALAHDLGNRLPARPKASLLHGDLWSGNVMVSGTEIAAFIDPACYYGDGEVDLAMLHLFGSPNADFYATYGELTPDFEERRAIYTLFPALVHLRLFGSGYRGLVERLLAAAGV